jgi:hypothetical protein
MLDEKTFAIGGPVECVSRRQIGTGSSFGFLGAYPVSENVLIRPRTTFEPEGREFESLRARLKNKALKRRVRQAPNREPPLSHQPLQFSLAPTTSSRPRPRNRLLMREAMAVEFFLPSPATPMYLTSY